MTFRLRQHVLSAVLFTLPCTATLAQQTAPPPAAPAATAPVPQQVIQPGSFNVPYQVLAENNQWSSLLSVLSNPDLEVFVEDVSAQNWLQNNAELFLDKGQYTATIVSFYKTRRVCRNDQIATGFSDAAHIDACNVYRYRVRQVAIDTQQATATLLLAAMVAADGTLDPASIRRETRTRSITELDPDTQAAILKASTLIARQSRSYDNRLRGTP